MGLLDALKQYLRDAAPGGVLSPEGEPVAQYGRKVRGNVRGLLDDPAAFTKSALLDVVPNRDESNAVLAQLMGKPYDQKLNRAYIDKMVDMSGLLGSIRVFHGSPHKFGKFDLSKIGTGEGAQAYGHGAYFAEAPDVAKGYQRDLSTTIRADGKTLLKNNKRIGSTGNLEVDDYLIANNGDYAKALENIKKDYAYLVNKGGSADELLPSMKMLEDLNGKVDVAMDGHLYEADLRWPDAAREAADPMGPQHFLDWDKPLSEQSDDVLRKLGYHKQPRNFDLEAKASPGTKEYSELERLMDTRVGSAGVPDVRGSEFYRENGMAGLLHDKNSDVATSEYLRSLGIPGIRYLDAGSRSTGQGSANYVVFDDALIEILKRNGIPVK